MSAQVADAPRPGLMLPLLLAIAVMGSALAVVQVKHRNRNLTTQLEALRIEHERLELEWAQLQLEEATLAQHGRVDTLARAQFEMVDPVDYQIVGSQGAVAAPADAPLPKAVTP